MSKKKHPEHVNHERWLVSYADFITLLFAFFVVLFASGQSDKKKQQKFASAFQHAFSQMALFDPASKKPALTDSAGANPNTEPKPIELPIENDATEAGRPTGQLTPEEARERMEAVVKQESTSAGLGAEAMSVRPIAEGVALSLREGGFFTSGSAELRLQSLPALRAIAAAIPAGTVRVEGHTDNVPMRSAMYASNWELSTARAAAIARFLLEHGAVRPEALSIAGYAEFHPLASNATAEGRAQNRRVDVVLLKGEGPEAKGPEAKGPEAKGPEAKGPEAEGPEANGPGLRAQSPESR